MTEHLHLPAHAEQFAGQRYEKQPSELDSAGALTASGKKRADPERRKKKIEKIPSAATGTKPQ